MKDRDARGAAPPPRNVDEALERARRHGLAALAESADAMRALLDAASLAATGAPTDAHAWLARATRWLEAASADARDGAGVPLAPWLDAVSDALDAEIERWEIRSRHDPEARSVLRAFLGVRELLWEFGLRARSQSAANVQETPRATPTRGEAASATGAARARPPRSARRSTPRLERVPVEG